MLGMAEDQVGNENLFWDDDQTWAFPNLETDGFCLQKSSVAVEEEEPINDKEEPAPAAAGKGKKRTAAARKESDGGDDGKTGGAGGDQSEDHELHIWTERERRKKMRSMFENLHSLLPHLPPKADKSTIVDEAVTYIKKMEQTLQSLERKKLERLHGKFIPNINNNSGLINNYDPSIATPNKLTIQSREAFLAEQGSTSNQNPLFFAPNNNAYELVPAIFKTWTSPNVILNVCGKDAQISVCSMKKPGLFTKICFVIEKNNLEVVSAQVSSDRYRCMYMIHARANGGSDQFQQVFPVEEMYKQAAAEIMLWVNA